MRLHPEKYACPRRKNPKAAETMLSRDQTERGGKAFWDAEQFDPHPARCWGTRIASQSLLKVETVMRALRTRKRRRRGVRAHGESLLHLHLEVLAAQRQAGPSMVPTTPVPPEQRFRPDDEWMQQHAHLARLGGGAALPLALLPQRTGTATADTSCIHHAQAPIGLSTPFVGNERLVGRTAQRAIRWEGKILT